MGHHYSVYKGKDKTIFIVTPKKIIVQTPLQEFYITQDMWDGEEDLSLPTYFIEKGIIHDMRSLRNKINGMYILCSTHKRHEIMEVV